jgi:hypothetical protein
MVRVGFFRFAFAGAEETMKGEVVQVPSEEGEGRQDTDKKHIFVEGLRLVDLAFDQAMVCSSLAKGRRRRVSHF